MAIKSFYIKESQLDIQQRGITNKKLGQHLVVTGGAGSGKSVLALWKAKAIQENGNSVLYVVKTVALTNFMKEGVSTVGLKNSSIRSFNKCFDWVKDDQDNWVNGGWKLGNFDYIILDEATDLKPEEVEELRKHCKYFIVFGDDAQQLFGFLGVTTTIEDIAEKIGKKNEIDYLIYNHRLPKKIAKLVSYVHPSFLPSSEEAKTFIKRCTNEGTELPHIFGYQSEEDEFDDIIKIIKNKNGGLKDVGILFRRNEAMNRAFAYFESHGQPCTMVKEGQTTGSFLSDKDAPMLMTFHSSKGLQFETVFVPNCSQTSRNDLAPFYVALTRTYSFLYIMYIGTFPAVFNDTPTELYEKKEQMGNREFSFSDPMQKLFDNLQ